MRTKTCPASEGPVAGLQQSGSCPYRGRWYGVRQVMRAGAPWHRGAGPCPHLRDVVGAWLYAPALGRRTGTGRGRLAGHFVWLLAGSFLRMCWAATS
ncbi:hypothetical protein GCM10009646_14060 [Streptomyces aureus]